MINIKTKTRIKLVATLVAIFMLISNFSLAILGIKKAKDVLSAYSSDITFSNANFDNPEISNYTTMPASPSNWTAKSENPSTVTAGVITIDRDIATDEKIADEMKLDKDNFVAEYPGMKDKQILMINAENNLARAGYSSSTISMSKGSFYVVDFMAYTEIGAHGSAKLAGYEELENTLLHINTNGQWKNYRIYVATSNFTAISPTLEFWLGVDGESKSTGAVFFDKVNVYQYDNSTFVASFNAQAENKSYVNLQNRYVTNFLNNPSFETPLGANNWQLIDGSMSGDNNTINGIVNVADFDKNATKIDEVIKNTNIEGNVNALLINNLKKGFVGYKSEYFTIEQNKLYKLSFLVKSNITSGSATVDLVEKNPYTDETSPYYYAGSSYEAQTFTMSSVASSSSNEVYNGWQQHSFYIKGSTIIDEQLSLELRLGSDETGAKGYILFDNFTLETITSSEYNDNSGDGTVANLDKYATETTIKNGAFNLITIDDVEQNYPYAPQNWTLTTKNQLGNVLNGVVNTGVDGSALSIPQVIYKAGSKNNVLMIGNLSQNNQNYKSESASISENSYAKISVDVLTYNLNGAKAGIKIVNGDNILGEIANIETNETWKTYNILIKTGFTSANVSVELSLGENTEGTGYAFFDNVYYSSSLTEEAFDADTENKKIDLSNYDFSNYSAKSGDIQGLFETYDFVGENKGNVNADKIHAGVVDVTKFGNATDGYYETTFTNPEKPEGENNNVLIIEATDDVYYTYTAKTSTNIQEGNYYKIDVKIKTQNLAQNENNKKYKDTAKTNAYPYGATINIDGIDASFAGIDTNGEWKTYTFFINCTTTSDIKVQLGLGGENALTSGAVYFAKAQINKIEEDEYTEGIKILEEDETIDNVLAIGNTDVDKDNEEDDKKSSGVNFDWLLVPSLIFGVAIIFAVVMVILRNTKKSHKKVKVKNVYETDSTKKPVDSHKNTLASLNKQKAEAVKKQNQIAEKLNAEKLKDGDVAKANVEKLQKEYDELTQKIEEINNAKKQEIKSHRQKTANLNKK